MAVEAKALPDMRELPRLGVPVSRPLGEVMRSLRELAAIKIQGVVDIFSRPKTKTLDRAAYTGIGALRMPLSLKMDITREDTQNFWHINQPNWD